MKKLRILGLLTVFFCCLNSVLAQKLVKAKKVKLYDGIVCYEKSKDPFTGIVLSNNLPYPFVFSSEIQKTDNSKYVIEEFMEGLILLKVYSKEMCQYAEFSFNDGKLDGLTAFWSNKKSNLISELNFKNGVLEGISSVWDKKGNKKFEGSFKNGNKEGLCKEWYSDGELSLESNFKNGKKDGLCKEWYLDGTLRLEFNYENGEIEGLCKEWYSNGSQKFEGRFKNGIQEGLHIYWNENGDWTSIKNYDANGLETYLTKKDLSKEMREMLPNKVKQLRTNSNREVLYRNTSILFSGIYQAYYPDGELSLESNFKNGKKDGLCKEWYLDGTLRLEFNYENGEIEGLCKEWYSNGSQKFEGRFKNGTKDSLWILWDAYGDMNIHKYENGQNIPVLKDDLNQELLNKLNIPLSVNFSDLKEIDDIFYYKDFQTISFSGRIKEFYDNGKLKLDFKFLNGYITLQKWYFANGLLAELADYEKREFKVYHKNGKLRYDSENKVTNNYNGGINKNVYSISTNYSDNIKGWHKEYHENGKLYKQFKIIESTDKEYGYKVYNLDSIYKEWHSNGFQSKKFNYLNGILDGSYKEWHGNGRLYIQTSYINGEKEGSYKEWHDNGRLHIQTSYVNGEKEGSYKYWSYDGDYYYTEKYRSGVEY